MPNWVVWLIAADIVVTMAVVMWIVHRRQIDLFGGSLGDLGRFSDTGHALVGEFMRVNYSGTPEDLPGVLERLLDRLEHEARGMGLKIPRAAMKIMVRQSVAAHRLASTQHLDQALAKVA